MLDTADVRSLHLHSLDSLLADLVSGRPVGLDADGTRRFALGTDEARSLLDWYRRGTGRCGRRPSPKTCCRSWRTPPDLTVASASSNTPRSYVPIRVEILRFGCVQEYDSDEPLGIDFDKRLLLLEVHNG